MGPRYGVLPFDRARGMVVDRLHNFWTGFAGPRAWDRDQGGDRRPFRRFGMDSGWFLK